MPKSSRNPAAGLPAAHLLDLLGEPGKALPSHPQESPRARPSGVTAPTIHKASGFDVPELARLAAQRRAAKAKTRRTPQKHPSS